MAIKIDDDGKVVITPKNIMSPGPKYVKRDTPARITVVEMVYHQGVNESPTQYDTRYDREIKSEEKPYIRLKSSSEQWSKLIDGWNEKPSLVTVKNESDTTLEVALHDACEEYKIFAVIPPKESMRFTPHSPERLYVRSDAKCKYTLTTFPS